MKNLQKYLMILGTIMLSIEISACSKQPDFDAKSYVQSSLDAYYHGEYKDYANLLELSEKDAKCTRNRKKIMEKHPCCRAADTL
jgi:hypothetical protein